LSTSPNPASPSGAAPGGRAALVTGGAGGMGSALAGVLAEAGYSLTLAGRQPEKLEAAAARFAAAGYPVTTFAANLTEPGAVAALVDRHREAYGRLDVVVNNAGVGLASPVTEIADKAIARQFDVNLRSVIEMYREAVPLLRAAAAEHGNALVVNNASLTGLRPQPEISVYSALKSAVIAFTGAMNRELGVEGIKSTALCAGYVDTEMSEWIQERIPAAEMIRVADVAGAMRWLLSTSPHCVVPEIQLSRRGDEL
jgi:NAD(P)-dependent dehydrogenase (short-subunit alcohol dehydrogenase family)